jgi:rRNA maturation endonuclease Nob1
MSSAWQKYKEKNGVTPLDMLNPKTKPTTQEIFEKRYNICLGCPELFQPTKQCKKCGCFMNAKAKLEAAKCPIGKW